jgi:zinc-finger of transposase IS204/IS1001/IS1096/IS1165
LGDVWRFDWGRINAMQQALRRSSLVPRGFVVESAYYEGDKAIIAVRASGSVGLCPSCGTVSRRVHSQYRRRVTDLPLSGRIVQLLVIARRFRCDAVLCGRQIFTERFAEGGTGSVGATHGEAGLHRSLPRPGAWRSTGGRLRKTADVAGEQRYAPARGPPPYPSASGPAEGHRH